MSPSFEPSPVRRSARFLAVRRLLARTAVIAAFCVPVVSGAASAQLLEGGFSGSTTTLKGPAFGPCCSTPFAGLTFRGPNISGEFIFDAALVPPSGSGAVNVPLPLGTEEDPFHLVMGQGPEALVFTSLNALPTTVAQVQYNNGAFNGFAYFSAFLYGGHEYELDMQGNAWSIYDREGGVRNLSRVAASGRLNIGDANVIGVHPYVGTATTTTPEPASMALLATGLAGIAATLRRRRA